MRRRPLESTLLALALLGVTAADAATPQQDVFRGQILSDAKTSREMRTALRQNGAFVHPTVTFADLTGDEKSDAVVMVASGGAAGNIGLYVFSADMKGDATGPLAIKFRAERLYRATSAVSGSTIRYRVPSYEANDQLQSPSKVIERTLRWNDRTGAFRITTTREV